MIEIAELLVAFWSVKILICVLIGLPISILIFGLTDSVVLTWVIIGLSFIIGMIWDANNGKIKSDKKQIKSRKNRDGSN